ncbi:hypothetical protein FB567DRAFT_563466 [Paraphoma chrysanthemicola]|uniref:Rhodopsin domain-containing protein n=1 Tax=Paraphoma chrysanthemicola TaxID=798071 RepID=A0A8K0VTU8_9PLEO|nr:hypothetical protein FB567DRAFT_563466 [Paraphoma chrysanthemicola]
MLLVLVLGGAQTVTIILQVEHGRGRHSKDLELEDFNQMLLYKWLNMLVYFVANWAVKMSILALYYRIGSGRRGLIQARAVWTTAAELMVKLTNVQAQLLACIPLHRIWDVERQPQGCINGAIFMQVSAAINVATDVVLLIFPLPLLPLLRFNKKQRTALALILSIGLIPIIASTMRLCEIVMSGSPISKGKSWQEADSSWTWAWVPVWSQIEVDVGILAASLPSLSPLVKRLWSGFTTKRSSTPSQMPDFPQYLDSVNQPGGPKRGSIDIEKSFKADESDNWDGLSGVEDEIGVAKTAHARIALRSNPAQIVYIKN